MPHHLTPMSCFTSLAIVLWLAAVPAAKAADPVALAGSEGVAQLIRQGRSPYLAGDPEAAEQTFRGVIARDPASREAKEFLSRIDQDQARERASDREQTRARLMADVARSWQRPVLTSSRANDPARPAVVSLLAGKLNDIVLPEVSFTRVPITQVVVALSAASEEFDRTGLMPRGVNIVLLDPENRAPTVTLTLRHAPLRRVLDFATEAIGYQYEVQADAVVVRPGGETSSLETAFFPVTRATVLRMAGISDHPAGAVGAAGKHPVTRAVPAEDESASGPVARSREASAMKSFLQQAGVGFESVAGASLAYDGTAIVVTQTARNLERIRNILTRYNDVRQVEIEAKFMEVQDGALEELGVNWSLTTKASQASAGARAVYASGNRTLAGAFANRASSQPGSIIRPEGIIVAPDGGTTVSPGLNLPLLNNAPQIPGVADLAVSAGPLATMTGVIGEFDVSAVVRALSQKQGQL